MEPKKNGKKRKSPSVERQIALALVAVIDAALTPPDPEGINLLDIAITDAQAILKTHGYEDLESIPARTQRLKAEIDMALKSEDFDALTRLGQEMKRAKKGLPPLTTEKKPAEKKTRKKKDVETGDTVLHERAAIKTKSGLHGILNQRSSDEVQNSS